MLGFLSRLFSPAKPPSPRLVDLTHRIDELEAGLDYLSADLKRLRGKFTGVKGGRPQSTQDAPSEEIDEEPQVDGSKRFAPPTAHLARRFRSF